MLVITPRQIGLFQTFAEAKFKQDLALYFRQKHSATIVRLPSGPLATDAIPDSMMTTIVSAAVARAQSYGITGQAAIAGFVALMFEVAPNFDTDPFLGRYLHDADVPPNSRIDHLLERASPEDWTAVKEAYDPEAWGVSGV
jgi:hypothetical protein